MLDFAKGFARHARQYWKDKRVWFQERVLTRPATRLIVATIQGLNAHDASHLAAGVAYYAMLSLFPLLLGLTAIFGIFLPSEEVQKELLDFFEINLPGLVDVAEDNIEGIIRVRGILGIISIIGLIWSGTAMFGAISRAVNRAMGIRKERPFVRKKLRDLAMALGLALLFLLSLGATAVQAVLARLDIAYFAIFAHAASVIAALVINGLIFLLLYKHVPNMKTTWRLILPGALLAAVLFEIAKRVFVLYTGQLANYEAVYGSLGSLIALLIWLYFSGFITVLGAEFNAQYHRLHTIAQRPDGEET